MSEPRTLNVMFLLFWFLIALIVMNVNSHAQLPVADFSVPSNACINQKLVVSNTSLNASNYFWDFCEGDLFKTPLAFNIATISDSFNPKDMDIVNDGNNWFGFITSRNTNSIFRIEFGVDIGNPTPVITNLGNIDDLFTGPEQIKILKENENWFGLVINGTTSTLVRLSFGSDLTNNLPFAEQILSGISAANSGMDVGVVSNTTVLVVTNFSTNKLVMVNFGSSVLNNPLPEDVITSSTIAGAAGLDDITLLLINGNWYGLLVAFNSRTFYRLNFGSNLFSFPTVTTLSTPPFAVNERPVGVQVKRDKGSFIGFIQTFNGNLFRCDFGSQIINNTPTFSNLGNLGLLANNVNFELIKSDSEWFGFTINQSSEALSQISFPSDCFSSVSSSTDFNNIEISYSNSDTHYISLIVSDQLNNYDYSSKSISVSNSIAPDINFTSQNICVNHDINFISQNSSGDIVSYIWDFGDANTSTLQNPIHQYTTGGDYPIGLEVTASNGCKNLSHHQLTIYNEPVADFTMPSVVPVCTNQNFLFENTTPDIGYLPLWEWTVNGATVATSENLDYTFTNTANQQVKLKASIPGCSNEVIKNVSGLVEGPISDFSFTGQCEDGNISFVNSSSGSITSYDWDFKDSQHSTEVNPVHIFSEIGSYDVMLTASNAAGCNNFVTKQVSVYSKPQVNFAASLPPFSCNGTPTLFNDLTPNPMDSNIDSWLWDFGDSGSGQNTSTLKDPQHIYANAGNYDVTLTASTNFLCSATLQLPVTISQTPVANFTNSPTCEDVPINFTDATSETIAAWNWQIGSTFYSTPNPVHTFSNPVSTNATLNVTATNNCIGSITKSIIVPAKLIPDFSVSKNCVGQETLFTDITNSAADPVLDRDWNFNNIGTGTGSPATFLFTTTGNKNVTLTLGTQTGCIYSISKPVNIISSPQANFTASPEAGAPPLAVQFTNTSIGATSYLWSFNDLGSTTSTQASPLFTYQELGEYEVDLTATNTQNCSHTFSRIITVVMPVIDVSLSGLELMEFPDGSIKPAVTIFNHGNTPVVNLGLLVDISGPILREYAGVTILPNTSYRYVLKAEFPDNNNLEYLCIKADVEDITPNDNQVCQTLESSFTTFPPYPNPANGELHLDWILNEDGVVNVSLINSMGQVVEDFAVSSSEGLSPLLLGTNGLSSGVYLVRLKYKSSTRVYKVNIRE